MRVKIIFIFTFFISLAQLCAQQVTGIVYNKTTQEPMEGVIVYFDGTSKGTITNFNGVFKLDINEDIQTSLVVSFLGFKKLIQEDYSEDFVYKYYLEEEMSVLDEVFLKSKESTSTKKETLSNKEDIWSREHNMYRFKKYFLGDSKQAQACEILNEEDILLAFDENSNKLLASSNKPIRILNKQLDYEIAYELQDFEVKYVADTIVNNVSFIYFPTTVYYAGTSFYKILNEKSSKRIEKKRSQAYRGSVLHFMRTVYNDSLHEEGFKFFYDNLETEAKDILRIIKTDMPNLKEVCLLKPEIVVKDAFDSCSTITTNDTCFFVDNFGNHSPIKAIRFSGFMGDQRVGDALPLDYEPELE